MARVLILKNGAKIIHGTLAEITRQFSEQAGDASLEEVFFKATSDQTAPPRQSEQTHFDPRNAATHTLNQTESRPVSAS